MSLHLSILLIIYGHSISPSYCLHVIPSVPLADRLHVTASAYPADHRHVIPSVNPPDRLHVTPSIYPTRSSRPAHVTPTQTPFKISWTDSSTPTHSPTHPPTERPCVVINCHIILGQCGRPTHPTRTTTTRTHARPTPYQTRTRMSTPSTRTLATVLLVSRRQVLYSDINILLAVVSSRCGCCCCCCCCCKLSQLM